MPPSLSRTNALVAAFKAGFYDLLSLNPKQQEALQILMDSDTKALAFGGGANGGKSWLGGEWLMLCALAYPETRWFIGREELKRLRESTFLTLGKVRRSLGIAREAYKYNGQDHYLQFANGSRIDLLELKYLPSDPLYERYGSVEYTGGWIEEGGEVAFEAYDTLKSRVGRQLNDKYGLLGKILITCNPKKNWLYTEFYKPFKTGKLLRGLRFLQSLVTDNLKRESGAIEALEGIKDKIKRERLLLGNWEYDDDPTVLVPFEHIADLPRNTHVPDGLPAITVDVARFGSDKSVIWSWRGFRAKLERVLVGADTTVVAKAVREVMQARQCPPSRTVIDDDGIGGGVRDQIPGSIGFVNNSRPLPDPTSERDRNTGKQLPENYDNLKSQCKFRMAERMVKAQVYIEDPGPTVWELLSEELGQWKRMEEEDRKMRAVSKDKEKEALGRSPDYADPLYQRELLELVRPQRRGLL
ncbi:hypothetical protein [Hymenobacter guriensis]|uniref:Phage portal protein n=1 Tax=Hymenobacter guriensis TaxID=2793065 RepID=A0ABS0L9I8_9BACT|nr:hypothetical protein [Hymenobacter guriensis]MBG8556172.1 phage portal protein [Hymenobacter guriensis]